MTDAALAIPPRPALLIPCLSAANFAIGMGAFVVIGVLSPIAESFAISKAEAGQVMTAYAVAYAIASPLLVALTGAVGRRILLTAGLAVFAAGLVAGALAPTPEALFASRVLAALGAGVFSPVAAGVAAMTSAPEERGKALAAAFFGLTLAQVVGVPAGAWIGYSFGWEAVFWLTAALTLAAMAGIFALVPRALPFQVNSLGALGAALVDLRTVLAILFTVLTIGAVYVLYTYAAPVLEASMGAGRDGVTLFLLIFGIGAVFGNLLGGMLTDRIGAYRTLVLVALSHIVLMPVFSALPLPLWVVYGVVFVWSVFGWTFAAAQQSRLISLGPERTNVMLALNAAAIYVGVSFGSFIGGVTIGVAGLDALGVVGAGVAVLALLALVGSERLGR